MFPSKIQKCDLSVNLSSFVVDFVEVGPLALLMIMHERCVVRFRCDPTLLHGFEGAPLLLMNVFFMIPSVLNTSMYSSSIRLPILCPSLSRDCRVPWLYCV